MSQDESPAETSAEAASVLLAELEQRGAIVRRAKSGKLHTLDLKPLAATVCDQDLQRIGQLVDLRHLDLAGAKKVSDAGVAHLGGLQRLRHLDLEETQAGDPSIDVFRQLAQLQFLILTNSNISKDGLAALRKALIGARIVISERRVV